MAQGVGFSLRLNSALALMDSLVPKCAGGKRRAENQRQIPAAEEGTTRSPAIWRRWETEQFVGYRHPTVTISGRWSDPKSSPVRDSVQTSSSRISAWSMRIPGMKRSVETRGQVEPRHHPA